MIKKSIQNLDLFQIHDDNSEKIYFGCDQEWYRSKWKRLSGCGPTAVTNLVLYHRVQNEAKNEAPRTVKSRCVALMEEVWRYVTPTLRGIPSTELLCKGIAAYSKAKSLGITTDVLNIPKDRALRPTFSSLLSFMDESLASNLPIAFLNLHNGEEAHLDSWHWVTIVSLAYEEDESAAFIEILDEGVIKKIDFLQWYLTTTLGGGLVRFCFGDSL